MATICLTADSAKFPPLFADVKPVNEFVDSLNAQFRASAVQYRRLFEIGRRGGRRAAATVS
jgi:hypothetical protein